MFDARYLAAVVAAGALLVAGVAEAPRQKPKGFLGLELAPLTRSAEARAPLLISGGALIVDVVPKSAADSAGFKTGDIVTAIDNKAVASAEEAAQLLGAKRAGDKVTVSIYDV